MRILGISAYYHDSAAALIEEGQIIAAAQEERFTRKKHDSRFPYHAVGFCLSEAKINLDQIDSFVFYDKPFTKFERLLETYLAFAPRGFKSFSLAMPLWLRDKLFQKSILKKSFQKMGARNNVDEKILFAEHHQSHAASAFFPSRFESAAIITMDGVGEWVTTSLSLGQGNQIKALKEIHFPHSIGLLYSAFTYYLGFKVNSGEYKVMGLAPYGEPQYTQTILDHLIDLKEDGSFRLDLSYFDYCTGLKMVNKKFSQLFGQKIRSPEDRLTQFHMDVAASIQKVCEEAVLRLARAAARETGEKNLCLAGGVALNCVANGKILRDGCFENIWIQPAAGDAGGALGAALAAYHMHFNKPRHVHPENMDAMKGSYLGPEYSQAEIETRLRKVGAKFEILESDKLLESAVESLDRGKALGWFQGKMEFGPRALGSRSILGDPRSQSMQKTLNLRIKYRESFRPFAPSVLSEYASQWFDLDSPSPYMLLVADVVQKKQKKMSPEENLLFGIDKLNIVRSDIPAVTHIDYSARVQTVHEETNPMYYKLLRAFHKKTDCPVLVNTSFNVRGEPIVCSPEDAFRCFMGSDIETLAVGNCFLRKELQNPALKVNYKNEFELD